MLQWYDILAKQSNFSRTVNANGWTDREVNAITSYAMLHVSYRLNLFGGSQAGDHGERRGRERRDSGWGGERRQGERRAAAGGMRGTRGNEGR